MGDFNCDSRSCCRAVSWYKLIYLLFSTPVDMHVAGGCQPCDVHVTRHALLMWPTCLGFVTDIHRPCDMHPKRMSRWRHMDCWPGQPSSMHVSTMWCTCDISILIMWPTWSGSCDHHATYYWPGQPSSTHVSTMWCTCDISIMLIMWYPCDLHGPGHVITMQLTIGPDNHQVRMSWPCDVHVTSLSWSCDIHVTYMVRAMWSPCKLFFYHHTPTTTIILLLTQSHTHLPLHSSKLFIFLCFFSPLFLLSVYVFLQFPLL